MNWPRRIALHGILVALLTAFPMGFLAANDDIAQAQPAEESVNPFVTHQNPSFSDEIGSPSASAAQQTAEESPFYPPSVPAAASPYQGDFLVLEPASSVSGKRSDAGEINHAVAERESTPAGDAPAGSPFLPPEPPPSRVTEKSPPEPSFQGLAPWNSAPPKGIQLTPPGKEYPTVKVTGFFQADLIHFNQDDANKATLGDIPNGADFRRARLAATGDVWENVGYMLEMDFAFPGRPSFMDVSMDLRDMPGLPGTLRVGHFRQPIGMEALTSVREMPFLERPLLQALMPFRQMGAMLYDPTLDDNVTWALGLYRYPADAFGDNSGDSGGISFATRETAIFGGATDDDALLHVGVDYSYINSSYDRFAYFTQPEVAINPVTGPLVNTDLTTVPPFVDTRIIHASHGNLFGLEAGTRTGSLWTQAEMYVVTLDQSRDSNVTFWGAYIQAGYILTGEVRPYNKANGVFGRVTPRSPVKRGGGLGAWELAARLSTIDLNDNNIAGGRLTDLTAGLNWYLNARTKFQLNYIHAFLNRQPVGDSDADVLALRAQLDF